MSDFGIKVAQPGYSVKTAIAKQLVFGSQYNTLTVYQSGSGNTTIQNNSPTWSPVTVDISHGLGYRPAFVVYTTLGSAFRTAIGLNSDQYVNVPFLFPTGGDGAIIPYIGTADLHIYFGGQQGSAGVPETMYYKYVIFYQPAL